MKKSEALKISELIADNKDRLGNVYTVKDHLPIGSELGGFAWTTGKPHLGTYLIENRDGESYWFQFVDQYEKDNYYLIVFLPDRSSSVMELHKTKNGRILWTYWRHKKGEKGQSDKSKSIFKGLVGNDNVEIYIPQTKDDLETFLDRIFLIARASQYPQSP